MERLERMSRIMAIWRSGLRNNKSKRFGRTMAGWFRERSAAEKEKIDGIDWKGRLTKDGLRILELFECRSRRLAGRVQPD
jgi:hypothetical protein